MTLYRTIKIPAQLAEVIDTLLKKENYSSRAEYVKELIRRYLRGRGLLEGGS